MIEFSVGSALGGGALIGAGAALLLLANGRVAGIAGIVDGVLRRPSRGETPWRLAFLVGMATPALALAGAGAWKAGAPTVSLPLLLVAGFLVGLGARMGNGCTSGHGICGLARCSKRSLVAVATFMTVAGVTVAVMRHGLGG